MRNARTTICGLIAAAAAFVALYGPDSGINKRWVNVGKFIAAGGLASLGITAKDGRDDGAKNS